MTLREMRVAAGITTQAEAAKRAGLDQTSISGLERGDVPNPRIGTLRELARVYGCSLDDIEAAVRESVMRGAA